MVRAKFNITLKRKLLLAKLLLLLFFSLSAQAQRSEEISIKARQKLEKSAKLGSKIEESSAKDKELPENVYVEITANQINYDQETNYYQAIGDAQTFIPNEKATLYADEITFDGKNQLVEAKGDVRVEQKEQSITGTYASFKVDSNEYILNNPRVYVKGVKLKARVSHSHLIDPKKKDKKNQDVIYFDDGIFALSSPKSIYNGGSTPNTRYSQTINIDNKRRVVEWGELPDKPIFNYSAKEITFDSTKEINNVKIKGARLHFNENLSIPVPVSITTTSGDRADTEFLGPVFGTRNRLGGFTAGPRFYHTIEKGTFAAAPVLQIGNGPGFGIGSILSFNTPGDKTVFMGGYGTLEDRFIARIHKEFPLGFETNYLKNQFVKGSVLGSSQAGQYAEFAHKLRLKNLPFIDDRQGLYFRNSVAFAQDNDGLFSSRRLEDLKQARGDGRNARRFDEDNSDFRAASELQFYTKSLVRWGNENYNTSLSGRVQSSNRFYGSGDLLSINRFGPALEFGIKNISFEISYLTAIVSGDSPFLFDQFVDGKQAILLDGDYKLNNYISVGGYLNYNLSDDRFTRSQVRTELGPSDFKIRLSYDTIRNQPSFGVNMIFGDPVEFDKLQVKI